jgi:hypothetical protein
MLASKVVQKLKANWVKAESLDCMAEARIYNTLPNWECFIYAMNPEGEDEIQYIFNGIDLEVVEAGSLSGLLHIFNREGEYPQIDREYRPRLASEIFNKLRKEHG